MFKCTKDSCSFFSAFSKNLVRSVGEGIMRARPADVAEKNATPAPTAVKKADPAKPTGVILEEIP